MLHVLGECWSCGFLAQNSAREVSQRCVGQHQCLAPSWPAKCRGPGADFEWLEWEKGSVWNPDQRPQPSIDPDDCELPNVACELPSSGFAFLLERPQHMCASVKFPLSQCDLISSNNSISTVNTDSFLLSLPYLHHMICEEASPSRCSHN